MFRSFFLLICAAASGWLVFTFGFGMLVALSALAVGYALVWVQAREAEPALRRRSGGTAFADAPDTRFD